MTRLSRVSCSWLDYFLRIACRVGEPAGGSAGEVSVVSAEQFVGVGVILGLDQPALIADFDFQRVIFFRPHQISSRQIGIRRWRKAEVKERMR